MAAQVVQVAVGSSGDPQLGAATAANQVYSAAPDFHAVLLAAAATGDAVRSSGDIFEFGENFIHNDVVHKGLFSALIPLFFFRQNGQLPQISLQFVMLSKRKAMFSKQQSYL